VRPVGQNLPILRIGPAQKSAPFNSGKTRSRVRCGRIGLAFPPLTTRKIRVSSNYVDLVIGFVYKFAYNISRGLLYGSTSVVAQTNLCNSIALRLTKSRTRSLIRSSNASSLMRKLSPAVCGVPAIDADSRAIAIDSRATAADIRAIATNSRAMAADRGAIANNNRAIAIDRRAIHADNRAIAADTRAIHANSREIAIYGLRTGRRSPAMTKKSLFLGISGRFYEVKWSF